MNSGEGGIRTQGALARLPVFKTGVFLDIIQFYLFLSNQGASGEMSSRVYT